MKKSRQGPGKYYFPLLVPTLLFFAGITLFKNTAAQDKPKGGDVEMQPAYAAVKWRMSLIPVISFCIPNPDFMGATQSTQGIGLGTKAEFKFTRGATLKLLVGLNYLNEGIKFDTYYFAPGYSVLNDKNFRFTHQLHISEIYIPVLFKQSINDEDVKINSFYFSAGWAFRYLFGTNYKITDKTDGRIVDQGFSPMTVEHNFITSYSGSALLAGAGYEHKLSNRKQAVFFELYFNYNLSRILYIGNNYTNRVLFRNHSLTIGVGYEF